MTVDPLDPDEVLRDLSPEFRELLERETARLDRLVRHNLWPPPRREHVQAHDDQRCEPDELN